MSKACMDRQRQAHKPAHSPSRQVLHPHARQQHIKRQQAGTTLSSSVLPLPRASYSQAMAVKIRFGY